MHKLAIFVALFALLGIPALSFAQEADETLEATVSSLEGEADYLPAGADEKAADAWKALEKGIVVTMGAQVATYDKTVVRLRFADNSLVTISQNTLVTIDQFYFDKATNQIVTDIRLSTGNVQVDVVEETSKTDMRIATPNATASVTGTFLAVGTSAGFGDSFGVMEGSIRVGSDSGSRSVSQGEKTNQALISTIQAVLQETRTVMAPEGSTAAEVESYFTSTGATSILPGDVEGGGNPAFARLVDQEGNVNLVGEREDGGVGFVTPPPDQPQKNR